jgi:hypothetical protein
MKTKLINRLMSVAATTAAVASMYAPAQAAALKTGETFGTGGIKFVENTKVDFRFNQSNGSFQSTVKIFEVGLNNQLTWVKNLFSETKQSDNGWANGWIGTCGNTVAFTAGTTSCTNSFTFVANKVYTLGLDSGSNGIVYSTTRLNQFAPGGTQQVVFNSFGSIAQADTTIYSQANQAQFQSADPLANVVRIGFDDRGNGNDKDFQDVTLTATASRQAVPEPTAMAGLMVTAGAFAVFRRRRSSTMA